METPLYQLSLFPRKTLAIIIPVRTWLFLFSSRHGFFGITITIFLCHLFVRHSTRLVPHRTRFENPSRFTATSALFQTVYTIPLHKQLAVNTHLFSHVPFLHLLSTLLTSIKETRPAKGWLASLWQGMDRRFIQPVLVLTEDGAGTDTGQAVVRTVKNFFRGVKEDVALR